MKKISLLFTVILLLAINSSGFSQKCETINDPITGEKLITANYNNRWVYMESKGNQIKFQLVWWFSGALNIIVPKGSEVIIKLENDEIIKLTTISDADPKRQANQAGIFTEYTYETIIDKTVLNKLSSSVPVLIRLPDVKSGSPDITGKDQFNNTGKKYFKAIQKSSSYLLDNL